MYLGADPNAELVRHYLVERTPTGHVRLKGCPNEPDFGMKYLLTYRPLRTKSTSFSCLLVNLSALIYQHSVTPLALPIKLSLPVADMTEDYRSTSNQQHDATKKLSVKDLLEKGAGKTERKKNELLSLIEFNNSF